MRNLKSQCLFLKCFLKMAVLISCVLGSLSSLAATTKVGNGDEGNDLEGSTPLSSGKLIDSRVKAVELLVRLNVPGVRGLGILLPEVTNASLYLAKKDVLAEEVKRNSPFEASMKGQAFARTFAEPHAATRFFPISEKLDEDQLIALHIHEGLHRALPEDIREDESIVAEITLAITSPDATHDRVRAVLAKYLPEEEKAAQVSESVVKTKAVPSNEKPKSSVAYFYKYFRNPRILSRVSVKSMQSVQSQLFPFDGRLQVGVGVEATYISKRSGQEMGPLGLELRFKVPTSALFELNLFAKKSMNTLSDGELKNSQMGRDVTSLGLGLRKELSNFYIENSISSSSKGESRQKIGAIEYTYSFGEIYSVVLKAGLHYLGFTFGAFGEVDLADNFGVAGGSFSMETGRYRIVSGGPEIAYQMNNLSVGLLSRSIVNSTKDASFDYLGNLLGQGTAQGNIGGFLKVIF